MNAECWNSNEKNVYGICENRPNSRWGKSDIRMKKLASSSLKSQKPVTNAAVKSAIFDGGQRRVIILNIWKYAFLLHFAEKKSSLHSYEFELFHSN